jgi:hypothetical protein
VPGPKTQGDVWMFQVASGWGDTKGPHVTLFHVEDAMTGDRFVFTVYLNNAETRRVPWWRRLLRTLLRPPGNAPQP